MNFCAAFLILKMEIGNIFSILCFIISRKVKCKNKICAVYREGAVTDQTFQKWFVTFWSNNSLLRGCLIIGRCLAAPFDSIH